MAIDTTDTMNRFIVGLHNERITVMAAPRTSDMSYQEALNLAAWLVALADWDDDFPALLEAVRST